MMTGNFLQARYQQTVYFLLQTKDSGSSFSKIDPNQIDLLEYPTVAKVPWTHATLRPGDCIYIPAGRVLQ